MIHKLLLEAGCTVIAYELIKEQLDELPQSCSPEEAQRLTLMPDDFTKLDFLEGSITRVMAGQCVQWLHSMKAI